MPRALKFKTQSRNSSQWIFNSKASSHTQKQEQGLIFSTNHTGYFPSHVLSMNCWPKENRHFRYLRVTWHDLTSLQFPSPLGLKHQNMLQWVKCGISICKRAICSVMCYCLEQCWTSCAKTSFLKAQITPISERCWRTQSGANKQRCYLSRLQIKIQRGLGKPWSKTTSNAISTRSKSLNKGPFLEALDGSSVLTSPRKLASQVACFQTAPLLCPVKTGDPTMGTFSAQPHSGGNQKACWSPSAHFRGCLWSSWAFIHDRSSSTNAGRLT